MLQLTPTSKRADKKRLRKHRMLRLIPGRNARLFLPQTSLSSRKANNMPRKYPSLAPAGMFPFTAARRSRVSGSELFSLYQTKSNRQDYRLHRILGAQSKTARLIQKVSRMSLYSPHRNRLYKSLYAAARTPRAIRQKQKKKSLVVKHRRAIKKCALIRTLRSRTKQLRYLRKKHTAMLADRRTY